MVEASLIAAKVTNDRSWADVGVDVFRVVPGPQRPGRALHHPDTGGCQDGLQSNGPNKNQGAESSLAYLLSVLELHRYAEGKDAPQAHPFLSDRL